jgi:site-specific DNA-methyltransferase (adenine-specific)
MDEILEILYSSRNEEWGTPQDLFDTLNAEFHFTLDAAASLRNAKCGRYFTKEENGLVQPWNGATWLNPPYGAEIVKWMAKAFSEGRRHTVVCLVPARTDTVWFHSFVWGKASELRFVQGRLKFLGAGSASATFPSVVIAYRPGDCGCRVSTIDRRGRPLWTAGRRSAA